MSCRLLYLRGALYVVMGAGAPLAAAIEHRQFWALALVLCVVQGATQLAAFLDRTYADHSDAQAPPPPAP